jgi:ComF family protein
MLDGWLCIRCYEQITPVVSLSLPLQQKKPVQLYAAAAYDGPLISLVHKKFSHDLRATQALASLIIQTQLIDHVRPDYIVPVPLHWQRYAKRGYNQAVEIVRFLARYYKVPMVPLLIRRQKTLFQKDLSSLQRHHNVKNAFMMHPWYVKKIDFNSHIMLVDDVCTTGATLMSCMKVVQQCKPTRLSAAVAARAV